MIDSLIYRSADCGVLLVRPLGSIIGAISRFKGLNFSYSLSLDLLACLKSSLNLLLIDLGLYDEFLLAGDDPMKLCNGVMAKELILLASWVNSLLSSYRS